MLLLLPAAAALAKMGSVSRSFSGSSLAKLLLIDFLLMSVCLSLGDHARHLVAAWGMAHHHAPRRERSEAKQPFLSIVEMVIHEGRAASSKDPFSIDKAGSRFLRLFATSHS